MEGLKKSYKSSTEKPLGGTLELHPQTSQAMPVRLTDAGRHRSDLCAGRPGRAGGARRDGEGRHARRRRRARFPGDAL